MLINSPTRTTPATLKRRPTDRGWPAAKRSLRRRWQLYLLLVVPLAWFVIFKYIPMSNAVIAFKDYNVIEGIWGSDWAGLKYFERFFSNPAFWTLLRNTFILSAYFLLASFPIPIILALALNEVRSRSSEARSRW